MRKNLLLIAVLSLVLAACNAVADEFVDYNNEEWLPFQSMLEEFDLKIDQTMELSMMEDFQGLEVYLEEEVFPDIDEMKDYLAGIELEHEEIQELHGIQIEVVEQMERGVESQYEAAQLINEGQEDEAFEVAERSFEELDEAFYIQEEFMDYRDALMEEHDIEEEDI